MRTRRKNHTAYTLANDIASDSIENWICNIPESLQYQIVVMKYLNIGVQML